MAGAGHLVGTDLAAMLRCDKRGPSVGIGVEIEPRAG
jgi:hypothetical protein